IDWLRKTAKQRLDALRAKNPDAKLHEAQRALANDYGFASWRALKSHVDGLDPDHAQRQRVFAAARSGDVDVIRHALAAGFDPFAPDDDGRTIHQIAKDKRFEAIELIARDYQTREQRPTEVVRAIDDILEAASEGQAERLARGLDAHPELIDALGGGFHK